MFNKKNGALIVALMLLVASLTLLVRFGIEVQPSEDVMSSQISTIPQPSVPTEEVLVLSSEDGIEWKVKEVVNEASGQTEYLYYFTAEVAAGRKYRLEMHLEGSAVLDGMYGFEKIGFCFSEEHGFVEEFFVEGFTDPARIQVKRSSTGTDAILYVQPNENIDIPVIIEFYAQGCFVEDQLQFFDPMGTCPVDFKLYCYE